MLAQPVQRDQLERPLAGRGQHHRRGHAVEICTAEDLELERGEAAAVVSSVVEVDRTAFPCIRLAGGQWRPLSDYDALLMRKDPPFDGAYGHLTRQLDLVKRRVLVLNDPSAVRDANEKLKALLKDKKITEDENKRASDRVQKETDAGVAQVDQIVSKKEKEVMEV